MKRRTGAAYSGFAAAYDDLMRDAPYGAWAAYIDGFLHEWFGRPRSQISVLDLACGTGQMTLRLHKLGYNMIGADASADMLAQAAQRAQRTRADILWLHQDMRSLDLYGTVDTCCCVCDGLNYLLHEDDLRTVFGRVRLFMNPGGVFMFDMRTKYAYRAFGSSEISGKGRHSSYSWQNRFCETTGLNEYRLTVRPKGSSPVFEVHTQRAYEPEAIRQLLAQAGFANVQLRHGYSSTQYADGGERVVFFAHNPMQTVGDTT